MGPAWVLPNQPFGTAADDAHRPTGSPASDGAASSSPGATPNTRRSGSSSRSSTHRHSNNTSAGDCSTTGGVQVRLWMDPSKAPPQPSGNDPCPSHPPAGNHVLCVRAAEAALASAQPARAYSTEAVWDCDSQQGLQARAQALSERAYNAIVRLKLKAGALSLAGSISSLPTSTPPPSSLSTLILSGCTSLSTLPRRWLATLATLDLSGCRSLTAMDLKQSASLASLTLRDCYWLRSASLAGCASLARLDLSWCSSLRVLDLTGCASLTQLQLGGCRGGHDAARAGLQQACRAGSQRVSGTAFRGSG
ncbi:MAG: hypothetical protein WDW36_003339 [Sanguina aurantia]